MSGKKMYSAKRKRAINNTIVHIVLAVLATIWVFPIVWVVLTRFSCREGFLCVNLLTPVIYVR